jgi:hypothetical protein
MNWLPPESIVAAGSNNITTLWQRFSEGLGRYEWAQTALQPVVTALALGADADPNTVAELWAGDGGDYGLGLLPGRLPAWVFVAKSAPDTTADQGQLNQPTSLTLDQQAQQHGFGVSEVELGDRPVTAWTRLSVASAGLSGLPQIKTDVVAVHTQVEAYDIFATSLEALQKALEAPQQAPLWPAPTSPNAGLIYFDWLQTKPLLAAKWPWFSVLESISQPLTAHLKTIVLQPLGGDRLVRRGELTFTLTEE